MIFSNPIIILTPGFPKDENDSTCLPLIQALVISLKEMYGVSAVKVISFQYPYKALAYQWNDVEVISLGGGNKQGINRLVLWIRAYFLLRKIKSHTDILGILSVFHTECALVGNYFCRKNSLKYFSWLQGQDAKKKNKYITRINASNEHIIALSVFLQKVYLKNTGVIPKHVINNGILENMYPPLNIGIRKWDIIGVGSLVQLKNYELFIEIILELTKTFPYIKTAIAGNGSENEKLHNLILQHQLENNIKLIGEIPHKEVLNLMNDSKIFLHTSTYEGSSSVILEALYSGCYVASTCNPNELNYSEFIYSTQINVLVPKIQHWLNNTIEPKRILFNSINNTAKQIMDLFLE